MRAKFINEILNFTRGQKDMYGNLNIGIGSFLKIGIIIKPKRTMGILNGKFNDTRGNYNIWENMYLLILDIEKKEIGKGIYSFKYYQCWDLIEARRYRENIENLHGFGNWVSGSLKQIIDRFDIIE